MTNRKMILEGRISRLEKLMKKSSVKNEGYFEDINELGDWVEGYVMDELSADYRWERDKRNDGLETSKAFERAFKRLANKQAPELIDEIMDACADEFGIDPEEVEEYRDYITDRAALAAEDSLDTYFTYAEGRVCRNKRTLRESRCSRAMKKSSVKNEALGIDEGEVESLAEEIMMDDMAADYRWGNDARGQIDFMREFDKLADGRNPALLNEVIVEMADDLDVSPRELHPFRAIIARVASRCAADILDAYCIPDGNAPERWVDWMDDLGVNPNDMPERCRKIYFDVVGRNECGGRRCESRKLNRRSMKRYV